MLRFIERITYPLAVLTAVLGIVYWYWTTTPTYALTAVVVSIKNRDVDMFERYVDIDSVVAHAFDDVLEGPARNALLGRADNFVGIGFAKYFKREIVGMAHDKVIAFVSAGKLKVSGDPALMIPGSGIVYTQGVTTASYSAPGHMPALSGDIVDMPQMPDSTRMALRQYGITRQGFQGVKYIKISGSTGVLGLEFYAPKLRENYVVDLKLEDVGGYWRITQVANLNDLINKYLQSRYSA